MIHRSAILARAPPGDALNDFLIRNNYSNYLVELPGVVPFEHRGQRFSLLDRARKAVQDEPGRGVGLAKPLLDELEHQCVRHQGALVHVALGFHAQSGATAHGIAQKIAARDLGRAQPRLEHPRLRALACPGRTQQNQLHDSYPPLRDLIRPRRMKPS